MNAITLSIPTVKQHTVSLSYGINKDSDQQLCLISNWKLLLSDSEGSVTNLDSDGDRKLLIMFFMILLQLQCSGLHLGCKLKAFSPPTCSKTHIHLRTADWSFMTFLWWLCHYRLVQTRASSFPTTGNINVTHARSHDVGWWWWWHHYPWSSAHSQSHHHTVTTITVHTTVAFVIPLFALMKSMPLMKSPRSKFIWTWDAHYATGDFYKLMTFNFLYSVITTWQILKIMRPDNDDAIIHHHTVTTVILDNHFICNHCCTFYYLDCLWWYHHTETHMYTCNNLKQLDRFSKIWHEYYATGA